MIVVSYPGHCLNIMSDGAVVTCGGRLFQKLAPETGKVCLLTVERLNGGTASWLVEVDRSLCRDGTSETRVIYEFILTLSLVCHIIMMMMIIIMIMITDDTVHFKGFYLFTFMNILHDCILLHAV